MTRTFILRLLGAFGLMLALSPIITAGSASAQVAMGGPYGPTSTSTGAGNPDSRIQVRAAQPDAWQAPYAVPDAGSRNVAYPNDTGSQIQAQACGWYAPNVNSHYVHCGSGRISINVEFWWGMGATRSICVWPGKTLLSSHPALQGGMITYAYYNGRGC
ncbi:DUF6355 family natural product biosynthesis protein [Saccharothrix sp. BKS2]|uniref:DUF6355 family natural product biosynthesis protein n=1 Tax=Saccharothrix sp. BKS2 TaxID=3064400 RepID=UPI0039EA28A0